MYPHSSTRFETFATIYALEEVADMVKRVLVRQRKIDITTGVIVNGIRPGQRLLHRTIVVTNVSEKPFLAVEGTRT